ncbi:Late embryogenesis abundant (LEA) protein-related [Forsythia ovata]|uniref:Late embryogenesis abundant (LEA) protein-related n=1 Tax=Forsythia ovata TaxID=205694 RepID=A0ABD1T489_9LAMI
MASRRLCIAVALLLLFVSMEIHTVLAQGNGNGNGNQGNNNGNGNEGNGNGNDNKGTGNGNGNGGNGNGNDNKGTGNGNGNKGDGNGNGNVGNNNGNGNGGNGNGNGNRGNNNGNGNGKKPQYDAATTNYDVLPALPKTNQERAFCKARGGCHYKTLTCPAQCPERKPKKNKKQKGCFIDCSSKCEVNCKWRKPKCNGYGSLCYDPRFVGGDGVMFYFHGAKGHDFAIVSDENLHINAHFIGTRPIGRTRDFTWVQALSIMFNAHTLVIAAKRIPHWDNNVDALIVKWDGETMDIPTDGEAELKLHSRERVTTIERTDDVNTIRVTVDGLVEMDIRVTPIGEQENKIHNYQIPKDDSFAHLEIQFRFFNLSDFVEGILGKTYRPGYISPVKKGVPMPMMGGEDKYQTPSLYSPACKVCRFQRSSHVATF